MPQVVLDHFKRAAGDIGAHGDNDTLPFDIDIRFVKENEDTLAGLAFDYFQKLEHSGSPTAKKEIASLQVFSERLLVPTGPAGFRITTKIHPFWNIYINGLGIAIAGIHEPIRSGQVHSYRFASNGNSIFDRNASWRAFREATIADSLSAGEDAIIVQTDSLF